MVRRQAALWERVLQCVALGDGEALIAHFNRLLPFAIDINPLAKS
jgi:hypothetical protein